MSRLRLMVLQWPVAADKISATSQVAIEDCFRPYFDIVQTFKHRRLNGEAVQDGDLDVLYLLGKCIANASAFHERNRVKQALAVLSPGAEALYSDPHAAPLINEEAVEAMKEQQATKKTATKLGIGKGTRPQARGRGNRGKVAPTAQQPNSRPGQQQTPAAQRPKGASGRGKGK